MSEFAEGYSIGRDSNGNNNAGMWGGDWAWWIVILLIFGWGNNGWGFGGNGGAGMQGALTRADLCQDMNFQSLENAVRGVQQGLCDGFYAQNTTMLTGFNGLQNTIQGGFAGVDNAICNLGYNVQQGFNTTNIALMQGQNALSAQLAQCCCENRAGQADIKYQMAADTCAIQNTIQNTTRDIIDSQRQGTDAILGFLTNEKISSLQAENAALTAQLSQNAQTQTLINTLRPCPTPAYITCSPFESVYGVGRPGNNCGCGCC